MRSRYCAFVLELEPYLLATWHSSPRPPAVTFEPGTKWLGLRVEGARDIAPHEAEVSFVARYKIGGGSAVRLRERSRFLREDDGRWYYVRGD